MAYEPGAGDLSREYKFIKMKLTCCEGVSAFVLEKCVLISSMLIQNTLHCLPAFATDQLVKGTSAVPVLSLDRAVSEGRRLVPLDRGISESGSRNNDVVCDFGVVLSCSYRYNFC